MPNGAGRAWFECQKISGGREGFSQTIVRFEGGERLRPRTVISLQKVLEAAGVEFTNGRKPGVRLSIR